MSADSKRLFNRDLHTGIDTFYIYNSDNDTFTLQKEQRVDDLLDVNKSAFNDAGTRWGDMARVASIPISLFHDLEQKGITKDEKAFKAWLNDPDNRFFRTRPGVV
jgi:hypothetical protein